MSFDHERLAQAVQGEQHWRAQALAAQQQVEQLRQAREQSATISAQAGPAVQAAPESTQAGNLAQAAQAAIDKGADPGLFGDFSEGALAAGISKLVAQQVAAQVSAQVASQVDAQVRSRVDQAVAPLAARQQQDAARAHYEAIYQAHPNADSIVQSREFKAWVDAQPSVARQAYWQLFDPDKGGSAQEIVEAFDAFARATGAQGASGTTAPKAAAAPGQAAASKDGAGTGTDDAAKAAAAAIAQARREPPASLSSIPGSRADALTPQERMADMSGQDLSLAMENMTPAQIEAFLNRQL